MKTEPEAENSADVLARLAAVEGQTEILRRVLEPKHKSTFDLAKDYAGFIALLISIATGAFTVWNAVSTEPERRSLANLAEFQEVVRELSTLDSDLAQKLGSSKTENERATISGMTNGTRASLLARAQALLPLVQPSISFSDHLALAWAAVSAWQYDRAAASANSAFALAKSATEQAAALKVLARAGFGRGTPESIAMGEDSLDKAIALLLANPSETGARQMLVDLRGAYLLFEASVRRCDLVEPLYRSFETEIASGGLGPGEIETMRRLVNEQFAMAGRCPAPAGLRSSS